MTAIIVAAVIVLAVVLGVSHKTKASKPAAFPFPVTPSNGDRYEAAHGVWVFNNGAWNVR